MSSRRPRVLLGVSGSVAAVKWEELALLLLDFADVRVVHTRAALHFAALAPAYAPAVSAAWEAAARAARGVGGAGGAGCAGAGGVAAAADYTGAAAGAVCAAPIPASAADVTTAAAPPAAGAAGADATLPAAHAALGLLSDAAEWSSYARVGADAVAHIELRAWADVLLVAPASAHTLAKLAGGLADNLLTSAARAWPFAHGRVAKPLLVAPAMNDAMWAHPATAEHLGRLRAWGVRVVDPVEKRLACGDVGVGALADVRDIVRAVRDALALAGE
jgi:hypothetical protein